MITKLKKLIAVAFAFGLLGAPMLVPATALAANDVIGGLCKGVGFDANNVGTTGSSADCNQDGATGDKVTSLIKLIINIFSLIVGVVAVVMIIIGGLKYITSGGDSGNITGAKNTILYAIIGLVVVALAQFIVRFVLTKVGATVNQ